MNKITDKEVIDVMKQGGKKVVKEALTKWYNNDYRLSETVREENIKRWQEIDGRIDEIVNKWKGNKK
jgi:hypothetical protein